MRLGLVLRRWRLMSDLSVRDVARAIGISPATVSRVERGMAMDGASLSKVLRWLLEFEA